MTIVSVVHLFMYNTSQNPEQSGHVLVEVGRKLTKTLIKSKASYQVVK